jgi:peptidoglycan/LPS O-acetylase OafA/YrhL
VRSFVLPAVSTALAALWLAAAAFDAPAVASLVAVAAITAGICLAVHRRRRHRRSLVAVAAGAGLAVAALLGAELLLPPGGPTRFVLQLVFVALLAPVVPTLYAATFEPPPDDSDRSAG